MSSLGSSNLNASQRKVKAAGGALVCVFSVAKGVMVILDEPSPHTTLPTSQQDFCPTQIEPVGQQVVGQPVGSERLTCLS